jgi:serine/threonine-protein kinase HipA
MPSKTQAQNNKTEVDVHLGSAGRLVGQLVFVQQGRREVSQFVYAESWLNDPEAFDISPDLPLAPGYVPRRAPSDGDSAFHFAFADTEPDAWGRQVIERAHAKERQKDPKLAPLTELDYLCAVDDFSRMGALRFARDGRYLCATAKGKRATPPLIELERMFKASRAVENSTETFEDLRYLQGKGTSLGGMRPKCTVIDDNGRLSLGKFPSIKDTVDVTRGEVLALRLAREAGIDAARARVAVVNGTPVAVIERFDRTDRDERIPYLSAASVLQISRKDTHAYSEVVDAINRHSPTPVDDKRELWRRLLFNLLITNVDDHLQNLGFLYAGNGQWSLSPAFDINPMPGKLRESKTWLTEDSGPITGVDQLMAAAGTFALTQREALSMLADVLDGIGGWKALAIGPAVGLATKDLKDFDDAFEHRATDRARELLGRPRMRPAGDVDGP